MTRAPYTVDAMNAHEIPMTITSTDYALLVEDSYKDHLVYTAVAMAAITGAQGLNASNSADNVAAAGRASLIAALGVAGPPMTAPVHCC